MYTLFSFNFNTLFDLFKYFFDTYKEKFHKEKFFTPTPQSMRNKMEKNTLNNNKLFL